MKDRRIIGTCMREPLTQRISIQVILSRGLIVGILLTMHLPLNMIQSLETKMLYTAISVLGFSSLSITFQLWVSAVDILPSPGWLFPAVPAEEETAVPSTAVVIFTPAGDRTDKVFSPLSDASSS